MTINPAIVSFGTGGWYPKGLARLKASCEPYGYLSCYDNHSYPVGCPTHQACPYAFKPYTMLAAHQHNGHDAILWADASAWLRHDPYPIYEQIKRDGYILFYNGWSNAQWCNDKQLDAFGYTRDQAEKQHHIVGGLLGIDFDSAMGREIFNVWMGSVHLFPGKWTNEAMTESLDPRCLGSRHDQAVMSLIAAKMELKITDPTNFFTFDPNDDKPIFALQGL